MQENNVFYVRKNRFTSNVKYDQEEYSSFDFNNNLKSDIIDVLEFTNYLSSNQCNKYFLLTEICKKLYINYKNLNKYFVPDEFNANRHNSQRVFDIMDVVNNDTINRKLLIYKLKCRSDDELQFYVSIENKTMKLYLIDVYHIVIEATNHRIGKANRKQIYEKRKKCSYDIKEIQNELDKCSDKPREI